MKPSLLFPVYSVCYQMYYSVIKMHNYSLIAKTILPWTNTDPSINNFLQNSDGNDRLPQQWTVFSSHIIHLYNLFQFFQQKTTFSSLIYCGYPRSSPPPPIPSSPHSFILGPDYYQPLLPGIQIGCLQISTSLSALSIPNSPVLLQLCTASSVVSFSSLLSSPINHKDLLFQPFPNSPQYPNLRQQLKAFLTKKK